MRRKTRLILREIGLLLILAVFVVGTLMVQPYTAFLSQMLGQSTYRVETLETDEDVDTEYFKADYSRYSKLLKDEQAFAKDVQAEGTVLLQNAGLPIAKSGKITIMGASAPSQSNALGFLYGGSGSGAISTESLPSLKDVFERAGYTVNGTIWDYYSTGKGKSDRATSQGRAGEQPISGMTETELNSLAEYSDVGIVVIGRTGAEGSDLPMFSADSTSRHLLSLSKNERDLIDLAEKSFDKTIVLLNTMQAIELGPLEGRNISVVWIGIGGQGGIDAIPEILNGTRYPSGKTVDTYAYDSLGAPSTQNQGSFAFTNISDVRKNNYYVYAEGIYVGYRYYETRYADKVMGHANVGDYEYASAVQYPFGYGLSYTTFTYSDFAAEDHGDTVALSVKVTNSGSAAGKEAVGFYMQSPYTDYDRQNGIEKSAIELVEFAKTKELQPGESETLTVEVSKEVMKTFDTNGEKTYIVDAGDYYFATGTDAHEALNNILAAQGYTVENGMTSAGDAQMTWKLSVAAQDNTTYAKGVSGEPITTQFQAADIAAYDESFRYLSRADWTGTFPTPYGGTEKKTTATAEMLAAAENKFPVDEKALKPITGAAQNLSLAAMIGRDADDPLWDDLLNQLTPDDMLELVTHGGFGTQVIPSVGKPATVDKDGPAGISSTLVGGASSFGYPVEILLASTWNKELAHQEGVFVGNDALFTGVTGWYAPGMNIHRSAFSGRNFEYYSEDPVLSGKMGANVISGAMEKGVICYVKHFALNDQETNRNSACTFSNEQAIRELYLKPFEIAVREGKTNGIMTCYNCIGFTWSGHHDGLLKETLRKEWGFSGTVITDALSADNGPRNAQAAIHAGQDMYLSSASGSLDGYATNASILQDLRTASRHILYTYANSNAMNGISNNTRTIAITPMWIKALYVADGVVALLVLLGSVLLIRRIVKLRKEDNQLPADTITRRSPMGKAVVSVLVLAAVAIVLTAVGACFSQPEAVGLNTNFSPILIAGAVLAVADLVAALVLGGVMKAKKQFFKPATFMVLCGVAAVVVAIAVIACVMLLPILLA